ncbi:MAG: hypothetical protein A2857_05830 [Candidatus Levybacteria bacterium RIFCSPHIGHO2_01_FULL_36_15]|nr:MAG: hypothetical protein A2857_05830 [Candidatus Levybacteria bacterium RIFCSPHIGHO2_01_FULL_36_15]OGH38414.1 MAG: hypothetical protein A2905_00630 [Candidatus Levybacteria bacterium RIFCSPLOWO2_01_FULL_36_10]
MKEFLVHIFVPHQKNNHRAKLLHNSSIFFLIVFLLAANFFFGILKKQNPDILGVSYSVSDVDILSLTNQIRQENGLSLLNLNNELSQAAEEKAKDMFSKNYWAHFAPDGTSPWYFIKNTNYNYIYAGENLAKGFTSSQDVVNAWMNSPSHKENMLSGKYKDVGFAVLRGNLSGEDTVLVVEMFGSTETPAFAQVQQPKNIESYTSKTTADNNQKVPVQKSTAKKIQNPILGENSNKNAVFTEPLIDSLATSKNLIIFVFSVFLLTLLVDLIVIERKKIPRLVGHNLDHIMLIFLFILFVIFENYGMIF